MKTDLLDVGNQAQLRYKTGSYRSPKFGWQNSKKNSEGERKHAKFVNAMKIKQQTKRNEKGAIALSVKHNRNE